MENKIKKIELLCCPKCESKDLHYEEFQSDARYNPIRVRCSKCLFAEDYWSDTEEEANEYWNNRPVENNLRLLLKECKNWINKPRGHDGEEEIVEADCDSLYTRNGKKLPCDCGYEERLAEYQTLIKKIEKAIPNEI